MLRVGQPEWDDIKIWGSSSGTLDINVASHVGHQFITSSKTGSLFMHMKFKHKNQEGNAMEKKGDKNSSCRRRLCHNKRVFN